MYIYHRHSDRNPAPRGYLKPYKPWLQELINRRILQQSNVAASHAVGQATRSNKDPLATTDIAMENGPFSSMIYL